MKTISNTRSIRCFTKLQQLCMNSRYIIKSERLLFSFLVPLFLVSCQPKSSVPALKEVFANNFLVGATVSFDQISGAEPGVLPIVLKQFNTVTPENCMKWENVNPKPNKYTFDKADAYVTFAEENNMFIIGHILIDIEQTPDWVYADCEGNTVQPDTLLKRMREYIRTVVGRYKGRIDAWQVVNYAIGRDGNYTKTKWYNIIGEEYVIKAFEYAHEADPNVELYYNGFDMLTPEATTSIVQLVSKIKSKGFRIDGIGVQAHWKLETPALEEVENGILNLAKSGCKIMITEMDITVLPRSGDELNPYPNELPKEIQEKLAKRYADLFTIFYKHSDIIDRVNFWGIHDGQSWLNNWPFENRTDYPLLFDRNLEPKPAFFEVVKVGIQK